MKPGKKFLPILIMALCVASVIASGQERYAQIRIPVSSAGEMRRIAALGIALDHAGGRPGKWLDLFVSGREADLLRANGVAFTTLIEDWSSYYAARLASSRGTVVPAAPMEAKDFHLGSMGGYLTWAEVVAELDSMHAKYPALITAKDSIGSTLQGRPIWAVKISKNAAVDVAEPRIFYAALIHAREPESMMQMIYFMWYLLQNYGTDPEVTSILDHRELSFVPVYNTDGYVYNQTTNPGGGGFWRKNRRLNADGSIGVDLNRNYGFQWGYDDFGSSPFGGSEVYRGTGPFSEPETQAIRDFCVAHGFTIALNYHTYGDLLVYPWGYSDTDTRDSLSYWSLSDGLTSVNHYLSGTGSQTVNYVTNGDSDDWGYGDTLSKPRIFSLTPEVGDNYDDFWPVPSRIVPIAQQNLVANLYAAHAAGEYITIATQSVNSPTLDSVRIDLTFVNRGFAESSSSIDISLSSSNVDFSGDSLRGLPWKDGVPVSIAGHVNQVVGGPVSVAVDISYEGGMTRDTLTFYLGPSYAAYSDAAEGTQSRWTAVSNSGLQWDTTSQAAHSGTFSFSDSPWGDYLDNEVSTFTLDSALTLVGRAAELRFWTKWAIETHYDYATVEASTNDGVTWMPLQGKFSSQGSGYGVQLPQYSPGYDGVRHGWEEEVISLQQFLSLTAKFRFRLASDPGYTRDGMDVDDIRVLVYPFIGDAVNDRPGVTRGFTLEQNYPNPFNPTTVISYRLPVASTVRLVVSDVLGREVATLVNEKKPAGSYVARFDGSFLSSGVYFYRLTANSSVQTRRMLLLK